VSQFVTDWRYIGIVLIVAAWALRCSLATRLSMNDEEGRT
jgi:hypothetical protein